MIKFLKALVIASLCSTLICIAFIFLILEYVPSYASSSSSASFVILSGIGSFIILFIFFIGKKEKKQIVKESENDRKIAKAPRKDELNRYKTSNAVLLAKFIVVFVIILLCCAMSF